MIFTVDGISGVSLHPDELSFVRDNSSDWFDPAIDVVAGGYMSNGLISITGSDVLISAILEPGTYELRLATLGETSGFRVTMCAAKAKATSDVVGIQTLIAYQSEPGPMGWEVEPYLIGVSDQIDYAFATGVMVANSFKVTEMTISQPVLTLPALPTFLQPTWVDRTSWFAPGVMTGPIGNITFNNYGAVGIRVPALGMLRSLLVANADFTSVTALVTKSAYISRVIALAQLKLSQSEFQFASGTRAGVSLSTAGASAAARAVWDLHPSSWPKLEDIMLGTDVVSGKVGLNFHSLLKSYDTVVPAPINGRHTFWMGLKQGALSSIVGAPSVEVNPHVSMLGNSIALHIKAPFLKDRVQLRVRRLV